MVNRLLLILSLLILAVAAYCSLTAIGSKHESQKVVKRFHKSVGRYRVELTEVDEQPATGEYWGAFDDIKNSYVDDLSIWYNGVEIYEPMSCYTDLSNVDTFKIVPIKGGLVIKIEGGDASTGYEAQIVVRGDTVIRRSVHAGEFPESFWEKTQYHDEQIDN